MKRKIKKIKKVNRAKKVNKIEENRNQDKMSVQEIILRFLFGFLVPFVTINGLILFLFIQTPKVHIVEEGSSEYETDKIKFKIESILPVTDIVAYFQETEIPYSKLGSCYILDAKDNGTYQIKVTSLNKAQVTSYVDIETRDSEPPVINTNDALIAGRTLTFTVTDNQSSINYDNLYATKSDGEVLKPTYIDKASGTVQFKIDTGEKLIVHVEDTIGNYSETTFTAG